jgi:hypothetical protein
MPRNTSNYYPPREAARRVPLLPPAAKLCINPYILYQSLQILTTFQIRMKNLNFLVKYIKQDLCIGTMGTCDG